MSLVKTLFSTEKLVDRNCTGRKGKGALEQSKLQRVKNYAFQMYPVQPSQTELQQHNIMAIDEFLTLSPLFLRPLRKQSRNNRGHFSGQKRLRNILLCSLATLSFGGLSNCQLPKEGWSNAFP